MSAAVDEEVVREALRQVHDPEAGMNIVDLGLVYGVACAADSVSIDITMTTAACPMADLILDEARAAVVAAVPPAASVDVRLVWDPPWTPERLSDFAREHFGWSHR